MRLQTLDIRQVELAAGRQHQRAVAQCGRHPGRVLISDGVLCNVNLPGQAGNELHAGSLKQLGQRGAHCVDLRFIEAWTHPKLGHRGEYLHADVLAVVLVEQAHGTQGTPETAEACADNQDSLFHKSFPGHEGAVSCAVGLLDNYDYSCRSYRLARPVLPGIICGLCF